jgi:hypothetical protein
MMVMSIGKPNVLLKDFVKIIIFNFIQIYIYMSEVKGFANRYKFSHEEIEVIP